MIGLLLSAVLLLAFFTGCGPNRTSAQDQNEDTLNIVTTIFPPYDFVKQIAGEHANTTMLLSPGSESHSFEPSPQDIISIQNCDVFIYTGSESDIWVNKILDSIENEDVTIIAMLDIIDPVEEEYIEGMEGGDGHGDDDENHGDDSHDDEEVEYDEHVWTSPVNAKAIVESIADTLCILDETNAPVYQQNTEAYLGELTELDTTFRQIAEEASRTTLIFGDRFPFRYFADEYGLSYYAAFPGCSTDTEASAGTIAFLIDKVEEENIPVVFYIEFSNEKIADSICESTNASKLQFHSCHNISRDDFENGVTYLDLMTQNAQNLKEAIL